MKFGIKSRTKLERYPKYRMSRETVSQTLQYMEENDRSQTEMAVFCLDSVRFVDCVLLCRFSESRIGAQRTDEENKPSFRKR